MNHTFARWVETLSQYFISYNPLAVELFCLLYKLVLFFILIRYARNSAKNRPFFYLIICLATGLFTNLNLLLFVLKGPPFDMIPMLVSRTFRRFENTTFMVQFPVLLYFFRDLSSQKISRKPIDILSCVSFGFAAFYMAWGIYGYYARYESSTYLDTIMIRGVAVLILLECLVMLYVIYRNYKRETLRLLKYHNATLGKFFMFPYFLGKIVESDFVSSTANPFAGSITSLLLTYMIHYCARKLVGVRFLNMGSHVQSRPSEKFNFIDDFKELLGQLSMVSSLEEIASITKSFFNKSFDIPLDKVHFFLRENRFSSERPGRYHEDARKILIEKVLSSDGESGYISQFLKRHKIVSRDEIGFTLFYSEQNAQKGDLKLGFDFINQLDADIFLPIYSDLRVVGYVLIDRGARNDRFYTDVERDEMLICAEYIGSVIFLLNHINVPSLYRREHTLRNELYKANRILSFLKKSVHGFLEKGKTRKVGVLIYNNKKFVYCNQVAKDLLAADLNKDKGLEITQKLGQIGADTTIFQSPRRTLVTTPRGDDLVAVSTPNLVRHNTVITVANSSIADVMKDHLGALHNQEKWEYLLALKTTEEGEALNRLIPADTPILLNYKTSFFEYALTQKTMLLEVNSEEDGLLCAYVAHKIHGMSIFEECVINRSLDDEELGLKIFGINPLFQQYQEKSLLQQLHRKGTLFIGNVHLLSMSLQQKLLELIILGKFTPLKSDEHVESDIFLICATNQNLQDLVNRGIFLKELYLELKKVTVWLPSLSTLPDDEFLALAEGLRQQTVFPKLYQRMLGFTEYEKSVLLASGCISLSELKRKIQNTVLRKTKKHSLDGETLMDPAFRIVDLELIHAARLGRHALRDPKILSLLLKKFKGNQTKVAAFLGVNRSTVCRRCAHHCIVAEEFENESAKERNTLGASLKERGDDESEAMPPKN